MNESITDS